MSAESMSAVLMAAALDDVSVAEVLCCSAEVIPVTQGESMACTSNAEWSSVRIPSFR